MKTELSPIVETVYGLEITPLNESHVQSLQSVVESIKVGDHKANFEVISKIEDEQKGTVSRFLTEEEKGKIYDLNVDGQFEKAEEMESNFKSQWTVTFINAFKAAS